MTFVYLPLRVLTADLVAVVNQIDVSTRLLRFSHRSTMGRMTMKWMRRVLGYLFFHSLTRSRARGNDTYIYASI